MEKKAEEKMETVTSVYIFGGNTRDSPLYLAGEIGYPRTITVWSDNSAVFAFKNSGH